MIRVEDLLMFSINVSELTWDTDRMDGKSDVVSIGGNTGTLNVGLSGDGSAATGTTKIGVNDSGTGNGTVVIGKGNNDGNSTGKIVVGSNDDGASNGVLIKSTGGTGEIKINGNAALKSNDFKVTNLTWDTEVLRSSGDVVIGEGNNGTLKITDNTGNTGTLIVGSNDGASTGVLIKSTNGTGEIKI